jgi:predicted lipid carrier protein YhbT
MAANLTDLVDLWDDGKRPVSGTRRLCLDLSQADRRLQRVCTAGEKLRERARKDEKLVPSDPASAALPALMTCALRPLPTGPLERVLQRLADSIVARHPALIDRLGADGARRFGILPLDVPFALVMEAKEGAVRVSVVPQLDGQGLDARITGNLLALVDLIEGRHDGDALFFSRDLTIEGDIGAVLALRNAIDNAELDLAHEAAQLVRPLSGLAEPLLRTAATLLANMPAALPGSLARRTR